MVEWAGELQARDVEGLITPETAAAYVGVAQDAESQIKLEYPQFYSLATADPTRQRVLVRIVTDVVFRKARNANMDGMRSERDGVYSYTADAFSSSANIWFPRADIQTMSKANEVTTFGFAFGSIRRGGIDG